MRFTSSQFDFHADTRTYVQEISMLGCPALQTVVFDEAVYEYAGSDKDASNEDTYGWRYKPTMGAVEKNPAIAGTQVLIIND